MRSNFFEFIIAGCGPYAVGQRNENMFTIVSPPNAGHIGNAVMEMKNKRKRRDQERNCDSRNVETFMAWNRANSLTDRSRTFEAAEKFIYRGIRPQHKRDRIRLIK